jgi:cell filamentation protein
MYDAVVDEYCYPGTTVLKNKLDLTETEELYAFEAEVSDSRADEELPAGDLDFEHFKAIHRHLFQDVYDWAGEVRNVRISKDGSMFCYPENIAGEQISFSRNSSRTNSSRNFRQGSSQPNQRNFLRI